MRIDKIKIKPEKSNIVDIHIHNDGINSYDFKYYPYNHENWIIRNEKISEIINISKIVEETDFDKYISMLKDIKFFFKNEINALSYNTLYAYMKNFRYFFVFLKDRNLEISTFKDVNYSVLTNYIEYLKTETNPYDKYSRFVNILKRMKNYKDIVLNSDIVENEIPISGFKHIKNEELNIYSKEEFKKLFNVINNIIDDYFNKNDIQEHLFVKSAYWFLAFCSGMNETALKNLNVNSFQIETNNNIKTYHFIGIKNRSKKGYQKSSVSFEIKDATHTFDKVMNELVKISNSYQSLIINKTDLNNLFTHEPYKRSGKQYQVYKGNIGAMMETPKYRYYVEKHDAKNISLSTQKIRNQWSNEMFELSKSEQLVSSMLGHESIRTTNEHYMKTNLAAGILLKFNVLQRLMNEFSKNKNIDDWVVFQKSFGIENEKPEEIIKKIESGYYTSALSNCFIEKTNKNCSNYIQCFQCKYFSIIGDKDLWKIMSFRESIIEIDKNKEFNWLIDVIDMTIKDFDQDLIIKARTLLKKSRYPFWKNNIMAEQMIIRYKSINYE